MKYEHKQEETRWYKYGPKEECKTKEEAIRKAENDTRHKLTVFYLDGLYRLIKDIYNEDTGEAIRMIIKFKYPISILEWKSKCKKSFESTQNFFAFIFLFYCYTLS